MKTFKIFACILLFFFALPGTLSAQWVQSADLAGVNILAMVSHGSTVLAGTDGPVYLSTDNGAHWTALSSSPVTVWAFTSNDQYLFAGPINSPAPGIYRSSDNGTTWVVPPSAQRYVSCLAFSGSVLLSGHGDIQRSTDNGDSWTSVWRASGRVLTFAFRGTDIYAGTESDYIQLSTDGGLNWTRKSAGLPQRSNGIPVSILSLACMDGTLFAGLSGSGIYRSTDAVFWEPFNANLRTSIASALVVSGDRLFAGTLGGGVYLTSSKGPLWTAVNDGLGDLNVRSLIVQGDFLLAGSPSGVWARPLSEMTQPQTFNDVFPLAVGKKSSYDYQARGIDRVYTSYDTTTTTGTVDYVVLDSVRASDSVLVWTVRQTMHMLHHEYRRLGGHDSQLDTSYTIVMNESLTGLHELSCNGLVWHFPIEIYRAFRYVPDSSISLGYWSFDSQRGMFAGDYHSSFHSNISSFDTVETTRMYGVPTGVVEWKEPGQSATGLTLMVNYPNPFNPKTSVKWQVASACDVKLVVYDLLGKEVAVLVNERKAPGTYEVSFDGSKLASGMYLCRMTAGSFSQARTMLLLK